MFFMNNHLMFLSTLILGSMISISSSSWFLAWLGLEINLLSMIPLMLNKTSPSLTESAVKYFLVQALASTSLIFNVIINANTSEMMTTQLNEMVVFIALLLKAGIPPMHFWFPQIISKMTWIQCIIMFTWQKVAPLLLLIQMNMNYILLTSLSATIVGALSGLNQLLFKPIMAFSAINHSGWILASSMVSFNNWALYFFIYCLLSSCIILMINTFKLVKITNLSSWTTSHFTKNMFIFNLFSLGGLPPFLGFTMKMYVILYLISNKMSSLAFIFVMMSLVSLYFYYRMIYSTASVKPDKKNNLYKKMTKLTNTTMIICTSLNVIIPVFSALT